MNEFREMPEKKFTDCELYRSISAKTENGLAMNPEKVDGYDNMDGVNGFRDEKLGTNIELLDQPVAKEIHFQYLDNNEMFNTMEMQSLEELEIENYPIQEWALKKMEEMDENFKEFCDREEIDPEDVYEPTIEPEHLKKMENMGLDINEYCNEMQYNVEDILVDPEVLNELYERYE